MSKGGNVDFWWGLMEEVVERGRWPPSFGAKHHQNFTIFCYLAPSSSAHGVVGFAPMRPDAGKLPIRQFLPGQIWECFETHVDCNTDSFQPSELAVFTSCRLVWRAQSILKNNHRVGFLRASLTDDVFYITKVVM
jgi:hypothetical protein